MSKESLKESISNKLEDFYFDAYMKGFENGQKASLNWIPFAKRRPDDGQEVIATVIEDKEKHLPERVIMDCFMEVDLEWWEKNVTAWMTKPKTYKPPCEVAGVGDNK